MKAQVSAEIRWFWRDEPMDLKKWFDDASRHEGITVGGGRRPGRVDEYLRDAREVEMGIKLRGGKKGVEVKGLVEAGMKDVVAVPFVGPVEIWSKWSNETLTLNTSPLVNTEKVRWLRKFDTTSGCEEIALDQDEKPIGSGALPKYGCNVELTHVVVTAEEWWTFAFEAFGDLGNVVGHLTAVAKFLSTRNPPRLPEGLCASYPRWLSERLGSGPS